MAKTQRTKPQKDCPVLVKARDSWGRGRFAEALHRFDKAVRCQPDHAACLIDAARAFGARFQADQAVKILRRLEKVSARVPDGLVEAAQAYRICRRPSDAARCLRQALSHEPDHGDANYELALLLEGEGDAVAAREHVERALHADPESDAAKILHARVLTALGDNDFAYAVLVELGAPGVRPLVRAEALSTLARLHESEGDFGEAFETMQASNSALERISTKARDEAEALEPVLMHLRGAVKPTHLKKWARIKTDAALDSPQLVLMTAPYRSGADLIGSLLAARDGIAVSDHIGAFSEEIFPAALVSGDEGSQSKGTELFKGMDPARRQAEALRYRELLLQCLPESASAPDLLIDNSPSIVALIPSFLRIIPDGKIIVPLRDPRDILVSSLFAHFPPERDTVALSHPFDAAERINFELGTWLHFRSMLDPKQWLEVRYESIVGDPEAEISRVLGWLGHSASVLELTPVHENSVGRWKHYESHLASYYEELAPLLEPLGYV